MQSFRSLWSLAIGTLLALAIPAALAQDSNLVVQGGFESAFATDDTYNSGGVIVVNGFNMTVPKNVLVQFPSTWTPFKDFAASMDQFVGFETAVFGNIINGVPRVAQIQITEFFEGLASGYIESVNFEEGTMQIQSGPKIRINDPNGVVSLDSSPRCSTL